MVSPTLDYMLFPCCSNGPVTVGLPPAWVDLSDEITANVHRVRTKMSELAKAHAKALMPSFGDGKEDQRRIEALTHEITDLLKRSEKKLQRLSAAGLSEDSNVRKNVQVSLHGYKTIVLSNFILTYSLNAFVLLVFLYFLSSVPPKYEVVGSEDSVHPAICLLTDSFITHR